MQINKTTSNILSNITVDKSKLSIFIKYDMRGWGVVRGGGWWSWVRRGGEGTAKEYLSELKSSLNQIKKQ